ncbi:MAG: ABC transporter ATP-binding protein [Bacteroidales bacterium]|nr:ABC transporter ATP-binding protein [Bacteroidales bacterium]
MPEDLSDHMITLKHLAIGYGKEQALLRDVNLSARPGEMVALIGRNGTGKSTLLKSIIGLIPILDGTCFLEGIPLETYDLRQRARIVSYVSSQVSHLPAISVRELVSLGRMPHTGWMGRHGEQDRQLVELALEEVQMKPLMDRKLDKLSDGERQRTMIARALVQDTPLMVLDEPTAFLDIPNKYELIRILTGFRETGKTIIYSTHDLETALMCADKLWVIHQGRVLEGAPEDLGISGVFDALFAESGIMFDAEDHRFKYGVTSKGTIRLSGEGDLALKWTGSALERLGFDTGSHSGEISIVVQSSETGNRWIVTGKGGEYSFENIYRMAQYLIRDD